MKRAQFSSNKVQAEAKSGELQRKVLARWGSS